MAKILKFESKQMIKDQEKAEILYNMEKDRHEYEIKYLLRISDVMNSKEFKDRLKAHRRATNNTKEVLLENIWRSLKVTLGVYFVLAAEALLRLITL